MKFYANRIDDQIDIIPSLSIYAHSHGWDYVRDVKLWHFHVSIQWICWYAELQIGRDD